MSKGTLYLVPNLLGHVAPDAVLPARTIAVARTLTHWVVETPKPARAFLGALGLPQAIAGLAVTALPATDDPTAHAALLAPLRNGHDLGLVSDAGCPGIADPGARLVAAAHAEGLRVVPLVGPSALLLALMASGMNGQSFAFHGYLPVPPPARAAALRRLEDESAALARAQLFIETPYRNVAMIESLSATLRGDTEVCVACDLTLPGETIVRRRAAAWRDEDAARYAKRPAIFVLQAASHR
ncbi:MAG: SAM-dependent methyltransferase [Burkholderiales bacterium]|nr:SAM-dependent methyltransferase [Burkholderiales bacterium]